MEETIPEGEVSKPLDLELLRLRVLATRKRAKTVDEREEGELSEHEIFSREDSPPPRLPPPHFSYAGAPFRPASMMPLEGQLDTLTLWGGSSYGRNGRSAGRKTKGGKRAKPSPYQFDPRTDRFLDDLSSRTGSAGDISASFEPQSCIVKLDSSDSDEDGTGLVESSQLKITSPTLHELIYKELEKQRDIQSVTLDQLEALRAEMQTLEKASAENEQLVKQVVAKQQTLKAQLKGMKELIKKGKAMKAEYASRQAFLLGDLKKKEKLAEQLQTSISAKAEALKTAVQYHSSPQTSPEILETPRETGVSDAFDSLIKTSSRSAQMLNLEKQALKVKQELMTAQIKLMQKRTAHLKATPKTPKLKGISALGKVMAMNPILPSAFDAPVAVGGMDFQINKDLFLPFLQASFPEPMIVVGDCLMTLETITAAIKSWTSLVQGRISDSDVLAAAPPPLEEEGLDPDDYDPEDCLLTIKADAGLETKQPVLSEHYQPYDSPLKAFKTYRFSNYFTYSAPNQGLLSVSFTNGLKPEKPICSFDLTSRCTKRNCPAQHFRDIILRDSLVLEDFMISLLTMPVREPFVNQTQLLVHVKNEFLKRSKYTQPLIVLVGVIMDTWRMMQGDGEYHAVSFQKVQSVSNLRSAVHDLSQMTRSAAEPVSIPFIDNRRCFLSGIHDLKAGISPRLHRYWESKEERQACLVSLMEDPSNSPAWLNLFLMTLSQGSIKDSKALEAASKVLHDASAANPNCQLIRALLVDFERLRGSTQTEVQCENGGLLLWLFLMGSRALKPYEEFKQDLQACVSRALCDKSPVVVDLVFAGVRAASDNSDIGYALALLRSALKAGSEEHQVPNQFEDVEFSPASQACLYLMLHYISLCQTYPVEAYLSFPFELVRRTDFYFTVPWMAGSGQNEVIVDNLQLILSSLALSVPFDRKVFEWTLFNYLALCKTADYSPEPLISLLLEANREAGLLALQATPLHSLEVQGDRLVDPLRQACQLTLSSHGSQGDVDSCIRNYWGSVFGHGCSEELFQMHILRLLGVTDCVDLGALTSADPKVYDQLGKYRGDPMAWLFFILSAVRLSDRVIPSSLISSILESAITSVGCPMATQIFLLCIWSIEGSEERGGIVSRMIASAEAAPVASKSNIQQSWDALIASYHLEGPAFEFVALNQRPVNDVSAFLRRLADKLHIELNEPVSATLPFLAFVYFIPPPTDFSNHLTIVHGVEDMPIDSAYLNLFARTPLRSLYGSCTMTSGLGNLKIYRAFRDSYGDAEYRKKLVEVCKRFITQECFLRRLFLEPIPTIVASPELTSVNGSVVQ